MSDDPTTERTAKQRVRKTRSRRRNDLPPLRVSELRTDAYDLDPACTSLVCPVCETWVPINRPNGRRSQLVPHHTERAGTADPVFCESGSHRRVVLDVSFEEWRERYEARCRRLGGAADAGSRRSTRVKRMGGRVATPVSEVRSSRVAADAARMNYEAHRRGCRSCTGRVHCRAGAELRVEYVRLVRQAPNQFRPSGPVAPTPVAVKQQDAWARLRGELILHQRGCRVCQAGEGCGEATAWRVALARLVPHPFRATPRPDPTSSGTGWDAYENVDSETVKRSGATIEDVNNLCQPFPDAWADYRGPALPLEPTQVTVPCS